MRKKEKKQEEGGREREREANVEQIFLTKIFELKATSLDWSKRASLRHLNGTLCEVRMREMRKEREIK